eukprot:GHVN01064270.1.p1 GENE.GHVN01064270.1~~GHVN01064270.1.p1  ORF type:complete len:134 (-),score=15.73 GHVN01064270.1:396-797(-)
MPAHHAPSTPTFPTNTISQAPTCVGVTSQRAAPLPTLSPPSCTHTDNQSIHDAFENMLKLSISQNFPPSHKPSDCPIWAAARVKRVLRKRNRLWQTWRYHQSPQSLLTYTSSSHQNRTFIVSTRRSFEDSLIR